MTKRRKWKKKVVALAAVAALIMALLFARCSGLFGFGGEGDEADETSETSSVQAVTTAQPALEPCDIRLDAAGVSVDGKPCPPDQTATRCARPRAHLVVTGDARHGDAKAVRDQLRAAGIEILERVSGGDESAPPSP